MNQIGILRASLERAPSWAPGWEGVLKLEIKCAAKQSACSHVNSCHPLQGKDYSKHREFFQLLPPIHSGCDFGKLLCTSVQELSQSNVTTQMAYSRRRSGQKVVLNPFHTIERRKLWFKTLGPRRRPCFAASYYAPDQCAAKGSSRPASRRLLRSRFASSAISFARIASSASCLATSCCRIASAAFHSCAATGWIW